MASNLCCHRHDESNCLSRNEHGQQTPEHRISPSEEVIRLGPLWSIFSSAARIRRAAFAELELTVAGGARLVAPVAHSNNHYEETIYGVDGSADYSGLLQGSGSRAELHK